jgi:hypothetical protein
MRELRQHEILANEQCMLLWPAASDADQAGLLRPMS